MVLHSLVIKSPLISVANVRVISLPAKDFQCYFVQNEQKSE